MCVLSSGVRPEASAERVNASSIVASRSRMEAIMRAALSAASLNSPRTAWKPLSSSTGPACAAIGGSWTAAGGAEAGGRTRSVEAAPTGSTLTGVCALLK